MEKKEFIQVELFYGNESQGGYIEEADKVTELPLLNQANGITKTKRPMNLATVGNLKQESQLGANFQPHTNKPRIVKKARLELLTFSLTKVKIK